jgi:adenylate kinase family enzyme
MALGSRIVIIGNSGSGKSTLAKALGKTTGLRVLDLDSVHWQGAVTQQRDEREASDMVAAFAADPEWIVEGVYGWLAAVALSRADLLIWLDLPWEVCRDSLAQRGPWRGATAEQDATFIAWAADYWQRQTSTSFSGHLKLFDGFAGEKSRLLHRSETVALIESH